MKVGIPSEIKAQESRVGLTPQSVQQLTNHGHEVLVENNAGFGAGLTTAGAGYSMAGSSFSTGAGFGAGFGASSTTTGAGFGAGLTTVGAGLATLVSATGSGAGVASGFSSSSPPFPQYWQNY